MSKKKNKKVNDDGSEKKSNEVASEQQKEEPSAKSNQKSEEGQKKDNNGGGGGGGNAVLLKIDLHCEGCANKVVKFIRGFPGVETVKVDGSSGKITVNGKVDPVELREKLEQKTHKKVELLSPVPKKDKENAKAKDGTGDGKGDKKKDAKDNAPSNKKNSKDEKTPKEPPVTTAVLKMSLHCEGCIHKIHKIVTKTKGYEEIKIDKPKELVTVKGAMDMKALAENLKKHLKRGVEIVPPKKDEKKEKGNGEGGGGGGETKANAAAAAVASALAAAAAGGGGNGVEKMEGNKMQVQQFGQPFGYGVAPPAYGYPGPSPYMFPNAYVGDPYQFHHHAPQMFSDENPNACSVM